MIHSRPCRSSSSEDGRRASVAATRLGRALANADITDPSRYQRLQQEALAAARTRGGFDARGCLTESGINAVARYLEAAVR